MAAEPSSGAPVEPGAARAPRSWSHAPTHRCSCCSARPRGRPRTSAAQSDPVVASRAAYQEAVQAYKAHDFPAFLRHAKEAERLRPTHGGSVYALASRPRPDWAIRPPPLPRCSTSPPSATRPTSTPTPTSRASAACPPSTSSRRRCERNATPLVRRRRRSPSPSGICSPRASRTIGRRSRSSSAASTERKILRVDDRGRVTEFVAPGADGLWAPLGMRVDPARRALWVASAALPQMAGYDAGRRCRSAACSGSISPSGTLTGTLPAPDRRPAPRARRRHHRPERRCVRDRQPRPGDLPRARRLRLDRAFVDVPAAPLRPRARAGRRGAHAVRGRLRARHPPDRSRHPRDPPLQAADDVLALGIDGLYLVDGKLVGIQNGVDAAPRGPAHLDPAATASSQSTCSSAPGRTTPSRRSAWWWAATCTTSPPVSGSGSGTTAASTLPTTLRPPLVLRLRL